MVLSGSAETDPAPSPSLVRRVVIYAPGTVVPAALTLATSVIFTRIFPPAAFGIYSLMLVLATTLRLLFSTWLTQSIGKFLPPAAPGQARRQLRDAVFLATAAIFVAESLLGLITMTAARALLPTEWRTFLLPVVMFLVTTTVFDVLMVAFAADERAKAYVCYRVVDSGVTFALRLFLVSSIVSMDIRLMFWSVAISNAILVPIMWVRAGLRSPVSLLAILSSSETRHAVVALLAFGLPMTLWYFSNILLDVGDRYVLNFLLGPAAVGIYDANYRLIAGLATLLVVPITITLHPYLMRISGSAPPEDTGRILGLVVENLFIVGTLATGLGVLLHADIAGILLGPDFREGSVIMAPVLAGVFLANLGTFAHKPFEILGRTRTMVVCGFSAAALNIAACFALIPIAGYVGAAYATVVAYLFYAVTTTLLGRRLIPWSIDVYRMGRYAAATIIGLAGVQVLRTAVFGPFPYAWELAATVVACCAVAACVLIRLWNVSRGHRRVAAAGEERRTKC